MDAMTKKLPKHEFWEEGQQIRKSAKAIPAHLAEGDGRKSDPADYRRFAPNALSSCDETQVHLGLLHDCGLIDDHTDNDFHPEYNILGKGLNQWLSTIETFGNE
ncbi:four helix bundle protein [Candidatus Poribacteria bacterium]|nr:four helix bundle protein [Candidatus Poribacteria bacterium]